MYKHIRLPEEHVEQLKLAVQKKIDELEIELDAQRILYDSLDNAKHLESSIIQPKKKTYYVKKKDRKKSTEKKSNSFEGITQIILEIVNASPNPVNTVDIVNVIGEGIKKQTGKFSKTDFSYMRKRVSAILKQQFDKKIISRTRDEEKGYIYTKK